MSEDVGPIVLDTTALFLSYTRANRLCIVGYSEIEDEKNSPNTSKHEGLASEHHGHGHCFKHRPHLK
jgi:hypothetical protein